jgi:hypothetical protein
VDVVNDLVSLGLTRDDMLDTLIDTAFSDETIVLDTKLKAGITREWKKRGVDTTRVSADVSDDDDDDDEVPIEIE